jgi:hypothetical protein
MAAVIRSLEVIFSFPPNSPSLLKRGGYGVSSISLRIGNFLTAKTFETAKDAKIKTRFLKTAMIKFGVSE